MIPFSHLLQGLTFQEMADHLLLLNITLVEWPMLWTEPSIWTYFLLQSQLRVTKQAVHNFIFYHLLWVDFVFFPLLLFPLTNVWYVLAFQTTNITIKNGGHFKVQTIGTVKHLTETLHLMMVTDRSVDLTSIIVHCSGVVSINLWILVLCLIWIEE